MYKFAKMFIEEGYKEREEMINSKLVGDTGWEITEIKTGWAGYGTMCKFNLPGATLIPQKTNLDRQII